MYYFIILLLFNCLLKVYFKKWFCLLRNKLGAKLSNVRFGKHTILPK